MEDWKRVIVAGNQAFQCGENAKAADYYQEASDMALQMIDCWYDTEAAINALVVSELNLAETQCRLEQYEQAIDTYASLNLALRKFQCSFAPSNPIVGIVARSLTRIKQEFLTLTKVYAYDILAIPRAKASPHPLLDFVT